MPIALAIGGVLGFAFAEIWHRISIRRMYAAQLRNALIAEYVDKQIWQFVSLDEWLQVELHRKARS